MADQPSRLIPTGERDFVGYGRQVPRAPWPQDTRIAVSVVVNYEEGSERSILDGDQVGEGGAEVPHEPRPGRRDLSVESVFEYGSRAGVWRLFETLNRHGVIATVYAAALAVERNPEIAQYLRQSDHEVVAHGYRWEDVTELGEDLEREHIRLAVETLTRAVGRRPLGWFCRYAASIHTRRLVVEEGGFEYDSDSFADDLPYFVDVGGRRWCVVPHAFDTNDLRFWRGSLNTADDFYAYLKDAFDCLYAEGVTSPKMMTVSLHGRASGRPGRSGGLDRFLGYAQSKPGVWFARRIDIARAWSNAFP